VQSQTLLKQCSTRRLPIAPKDQGVWQSQRVACPGCGKIVTAHPNGNLPPHRDPLTSPKRDTGWKKDGKKAGIYWRKRANGSKSWGFYADGKIQSAPTRQAAIDAKAKAGLRKSAGLPAPDTRVTFRDLAGESARAEAAQAPRLVLRGLRVRA